MRTYLEPIFDSRKSFYHKAEVEIDDNGIATLYSYHTPIISLDIKTKEIVKDYDYSPDSNTTRRHKAEFLRQNGYRFYVKDYVHHIEKLD